MSRRRLFAAAALLVAVLAGEVAGRWLVAHLPLVGRAPARHHGGVDIWPVLVILAKVGIALLVARLAWRASRAFRLARARERVLCAVGHARPRPAAAVGLSPRVWLASFSAMAALYVIPTSTSEVTSGCWPLLSPWLHTQALPVFALLAVVVAIVWRTVSRSLAAVERYADELGELMWGVVRLTVGWLVLVLSFTTSPRSRFGVSFESRPPPALV